jgi:hypothetical protein
MSGKINIITKANQKQGDFTISFDQIITIFFYVLVLLFSSFGPTLLKFSDYTKINVVGWAFSHSFTIYFNDCCAFKMQFN